MHSSSQHSVLLPARSLCHVKLNFGGSRTFGVAKSRCHHQYYDERNDCTTLLDPRLKDSMSILERACPSHKSVALIFYIDQWGKWEKLYTVRNEPQEREGDPGLSVSSTPSCPILCSHWSGLVVMMAGFLFMESEARNERSLRPGASIGKGGNG